MPLLKSNYLTRNTTNTVSVTKAWDSDLFWSKNKFFFLVIKSEASGEHGEKMAPAVHTHGC